MKVQELFEGPYHIDSDFRPHIKMDNYPSLEGLNRECEFLGTLTKETAEFNMWLSKGKHYAQVTTEGIDDIGQVRQLSVVKLTFQKPSGIPVKNELHAHTVYTHEAYRARFLAGALYVLLARYGYTVVSDFEQWNGGKALWKKMAKESETRNYVIRIWDDSQEDWFRDNSGNVLKYNAANLDDESIWQDIAKNAQPTTLMALSAA